MSLRHHHSSTHLKRDENYLFSLLKNQALTKGSEKRSSCQVNDENTNTINRKLPKGDLQVVLSLEEIVTEKNQQIEDLKKENALQKKQLDTQSKVIPKGNSESSSSLLKEAARLLSVVEMDRSCLEEKLRETSAQSAFEIAEVQKKLEEKEQSLQTKEKAFLSTIQRVSEEKEEFYLALEASKMDIQEKMLVISLKDVEIEEMKKSLTHEKDVLLLSLLQKGKEMEEIRTDLLLECKKAAETAETHLIEKENSKRIIEEMKDIIASIKEDESKKYLIALDEVTLEREEIMSVKDCTINELKEKLAFNEQENQKSMEELIIRFEEEKKRVNERLAITQEEVNALSARSLELEERNEEITKEFQKSQEKQEELLSSVQQVTGEKSSLVLVESTLKTTILTLEQQLSSQTRVINELELQRDENAKKLEELNNESKQQIERNNKEREEILQRNQTLQSQFNNLLQDIIKTKQQHDQSIEEMKISFKNSQLDSLENERTSLSQQFHSQLEKLTSSLQQKEEEIQSLQQSIETKILKITENSQNELNSKDISHSKSLSVVKYDLIFAQEKITSLEKELTDLKEKQQGNITAATTAAVNKEEKDWQKKYEMLLQEKCEEIKEKEEKYVQEIVNLKKELTTKFENDLENEDRIRFHRKEDEITKQMNLLKESFAKEKELLAKEHECSLDEMKRKGEEHLQQQIKFSCEKKDSFHQLQMNTLKESHSKSLQSITEELIVARNKIASFENDSLSLSQSLSFTEEINKCYENQISDLKEQLEKKQQIKENKELLVLKEQQQQEEMRKKKNQEVIQQLKSQNLLEIQELKQEKEQQIITYRNEFDMLTGELENARKEKEQVSHQLTQQLNQLKEQLISFEQQLMIEKQEKKEALKMVSLLQEGIKRKEEDLINIRLENFEQAELFGKETFNLFSVKEKELSSSQELILSLENDMNNLKQQFLEEKQELFKNHQTTFEELIKEFSNEKSEVEKSYQLMQELQSKEMAYLLSCKENEFKEVCLKQDETIQDLLNQNQALQQAKGHQDHEKELHHELVIRVKGKLERQLETKEIENEKERKIEREHLLNLEMRYKKANERIIQQKNELTAIEEEKESIILQLKEELQNEKEHFDNQFTVIREKHAETIQQLQKEKNQELENLKTSFFKEIEEFKGRNEELEKEKDQYMSSASSTVSLDETFTMTSSCSFSNPYNNNRSRRSNHLSQSLSSSYCSCASHLCSLSLRSELSSSLIKQFLSLYSLIENSFNGESPFVCDFSELQSLSSASSSSSNDENEESVMNKIATQIEYLEFFFEQLFHMINEILYENKQKKQQPFQPDDNSTMIVNPVNEVTERVQDDNTSFLSTASSVSTFNDKECEAFIKESIETKVKLANVTCDVEKQKQKIFELSSSSSSSSQQEKTETSQEQGVPKKMIDFMNLNEETGKRRRKKSHSSSSIQLPKEFLKFIQEKVIQFSSHNSSTKENNRDNNA
jgi:hypothetical protein